MEAKSSEESNKEAFTDEMQSEITERMNRLMSVSDFLCKECVDDMDFLYCDPYKSTDSQRKKVGDLLTTLKVPKLFLAIWKTHFEMDFLNNDNILMKTLMKRILSILCNYMDISTALCAQVFESDLHKVALNYLKTDYLDPSKTVGPVCHEVVYNLMTILLNMLQKVPESIQSLREQKAFDVFQRFRGSPRNTIACMALILQGYIITEEENDLVNSDDSNFVFLKDVLGRALKPNNSNRRAEGLLPIEVISALNRLAVNDNNKIRIVGVGLLPFYVMLLHPKCSEEEQEAAAEGLWFLAFKCTDEIENEPGCVAALKKLANGNSERLKRLAEGVLWTLEESKKKKNACGQISRSGQESQRHVFISYQWDSQPIIKRLVRSLKEEGFQVWVDYEKMSGSILEAMAKAVEEAAVVVVCLSQKYKESPNCRTVDFGISEAEYSFRLRKEILPLRLQSLYWPDGWLGALVGNKLMHDFTSDGKYSESIIDLIRELGVRGKTTGYEDEPDSNVDIVTQISLPTTGSSLGHISSYATWTSVDIELWLQENNLEEFQDWFKDFDGTHLIEYKGMFERAPETFYWMLRERFSLRDMLNLSKALKQL